MESYIFNIGLGYLIGLGVFGYFLLLYIIRKAGKKFGWPLFVTNFFVMLHFFFGLNGVSLVPIIYFKNHRNFVVGLDGIIFSTTLIATLFVVLYVVKHWDDFFKEK